MSREIVEAIKTDALKMAKVIAEEAYEEAKLIRLEREAEELRQKINEKLRKEEAGGKIKWN